MVVLGGSGVQKLLFLCAWLSGHVPKADFEETLMHGLIATLTGTAGWVVWLAFSAELIVLGV
jgi:hypothetical protein